MITNGLHHVTCIATDPQRNLDFYRKVLGLRLVKLTVNFDAPDVYHFYYGDQLGRPGTILTFFPFTDAGPGRRGFGVTETTSFAISAGAVDDWLVRLAEHDVPTGKPMERFGHAVVPFRDPDGLSLELVADWPSQSSSIGGISSVRLAVEAPDRTVRVLTELLGYSETAEADGLKRYSAPGTAMGRHVDVLCAPGTLPARMGGGSVHHIAFRAADYDALDHWREAVAGMGFNVTPVLDRNYFRSIYFREPGGVLFEVASDPPGFAVDEALESLGTGLKLPARYESQRAAIERRLPTISLSR